MFAFQVKRSSTHKHIQKLGDKARRFEVCANDSVDISVTMLFWRQTLSSGIQFDHFTNSGVLELIKVVVSPPQKTYLLQTKFKVRTVSHKQSFFPLGIYGLSAKRVDHKSKGKHKDP